MILLCLFEKGRHIGRGEAHFSCVGGAVCYMSLWSIRLYLDHKVQAWFSHTSLRVEGQCVFCFLSGFKEGLDYALCHLV